MGMENQPPRLHLPKPSSDHLSAYKSASNEAIAQLRRIRKRDMTLELVGYAIGGAYALPGRLVGALRLSREAFREGVERAVNPNKVETSE